MNSYSSTMLEFMKSQDDLEYSLGDTLDVKTSIVLVAITFLAAQSAVLLSKNAAASVYCRWGQILSVSFLIACGFRGKAVTVPG
jgi:hypothetical protein